MTHGPFKLVAFLDYYFHSTPSIYKVNLKKYGGTKMGLNGPTPFMISGDLATHAIPNGLVATLRQLPTVYIFLKWKSYF